MSEKIDRRIGGSLLPWVLVAVFAAAAVAGFLVWSRLGAVPADSTTAQLAAAAATQPARADEPLSMTIYCPVEGALAAGTVAVNRLPDAQSQAREALASLFADPRAAQSALFKEIKVRQLFLDASGTAYVDLSLLKQGGPAASAGEELLAIYAVVDTLAQNFEEIREVRFLVDGREAQTLAGHIDLTRKFEKRMDFVRQ